SRPELMVCRPLAGPAPWNHGPRPASAPVPRVGVPEPHLAKVPFAFTNPGTQSGKPRNAGASGQRLGSVGVVACAVSVVPTGHGTLMLFPRTSLCAPTKR